MISIDAIRTISVPVWCACFGLATGCSAPSDRTGGIPRMTGSGMLRSDMRHSLAAFGLVLLLHLAALVFLMRHRVADTPQEISALMVQVLLSVPPQESVPTLPRETRPRPVPSRPQASSRPQSVAASPLPATTHPFTETNIPITPASSAPMVSTEMTPPRFDANYLDNPPPVYPPLSRKLGEEGRVMLRVHVDSGGLPTRVEIHAGSGSSRLDQAAERAVWRWKFVPARRGGETIAASVVVPIVFNLRE